MLSKLGSRRWATKVASLSLRPVALKACRVAPMAPRMQTSAPAVRQFSEQAITGLPSLHELTEDEQALKETVSRFAKDVLLPKVMDMDQKGEVDPAIMQALFEQGLMGIETPVELGGSGMTFTAACIAIEELAKVDPTISVIVDVQNTLINTCFRVYGTEAQRNKYLPMLATNTLASFCLSEVSSGSDAFALQTTATKQGDKWLINGKKCWITNAGQAGVFVVFANVDKSQGYRGITAFIVEKGAKGLTVGKKEDKLGIRASSTCEVFFDNVEVSEDAVLGKVGGGYKIAIQTLNEGRIGIGAQMLGLAEGAFDHAMPYIHERKQFGQPIANFQGMQFNVAQAATDIEAAKLLVYNAARLRDSGRNCTKEAAMAKLTASQVAERVASQAIEWRGGVGFVRGFAEKMFRDSKIGSIYEGTSNIQKQAIAKLISKEWQQ